MVGIVLGGRCCGAVGGVTWHAGNMEGAPCVVDAGDVGVWLSGLLVGWLSCFVGDMGRQWWWGLLVGRVVARRARCG